MDIFDVARAAGVSRGTVSRVINDRPDVSPETRKRVLHVIQELNYQPSPLARGLISKATNTVGLLVPDIIDPFFTELARAVEDVASQHGFLVVLCNTDRLPAKEIAYIGALRAFRARGFVVAGGSTVNEHLLKLHREGIPVVLAHRWLQSNELPSVTVDNVGAAAEAADHLLRQGHKRVAFVSGPLTSPTSTQRLEGFRRALDQHSLPHDPSLVVEADFTMAGGRRAAELLIIRPERPSAIFLANDHMAIGAIQALKAVGLRIPEDVAVMGFDDIPVAEAVDPSLSTVRLPLYKIGAEAMRVFVDLAAQKPVERGQIILRHELVVRRSTAIVLS